MTQHDNVKHDNRSSQLLPNWETIQRGEIWQGGKLVIEYVEGRSKGGGSHCFPEASMTHTNAEQKDLKSRNECIAAMEQQRDEKAKVWFGDVLSNELVFRRANGTVIDKATFLKNLDDPTSFTSRDTEDINITILGGRALVTAIVHTMKADGTENRYRNIRLFSKRATGWTLELWYNYEITDL